MSGRPPTLTVVVTAATAALVAAAFLTGWMVVEVETPEPGGIHLTVPVPLGLLQAALALLPRDAFPRQELPEDFPLDREGLLAIVEALTTAPAGSHLDVETPDSGVSLTLSGAELVVAVRDHEAHVDLRVPLDGLKDALEEWDGRTLDPRTLLTVLASSGHGPLLRVGSRDARVRIDLR